MKWTGLNELREQFLDFFESKGHMRLGSFSLVPDKKEKSLLLINSGMAPMKRWFLMKETPPAHRVTTCQKCIRTPDIDRVGKTDRHGTFFEMLGNFSFGDYFKEEATQWAWEFVTQVLKMPQDKIYVSIFEDDEQSYEIWTSKRGVSPDHMVRLGREDNFWEIGSGPCGPCSELYFDRGEKYGCGRPDCGPGCECDRFVEFWNLVFSEFNSDGNGGYTKMAHPNIDTGMGLERLACILQGVDNLFEVDTVRQIMQSVCDIAKVKYHDDPRVDVSLRVITDHIRSCVFLIADGVVPGNEGRGYVLRRLIRRAYRNGRQIGILGPFLCNLADTVIQVNKGVYPELEEHADFIKKTLKVEETGFDHILKRGMNMLNEAIDRVDQSLDKMLSGQEAFRLCDTYGFPFDLIKEVVHEHEMQVDEEGFAKLMERQKQRARSAAAKAEGNAKAWAESERSYAFEDAPTDFVGYTETECESKLLHVIHESGEEGSAKEGDTVYLVFDRTPLYAESGGQVGDRGIWKSEHGVVDILNCQKLPTGHYMHQAIVVSGVHEPGNLGTLRIDQARRFATSCNHTAAHLLQKALQDVLGAHVHQAGQHVDHNRLRFDFTHFQAVSIKEQQQVERLVNEKIWQALPVHIYETSIEDARKKGAMALFGEKYGDVVRVVDAGGYAIELCGGTHVDNTAKLGIFKIVHESGVSVGVRRIEAVTNQGVLQMIYHAHGLIAQACSKLKIEDSQELPNRIDSTLHSLKSAQTQIKQLQEHVANAYIQQMLKNGFYEMSGLNVAYGSMENIDDSVLRMMGDRIRSEHTDSVAVVGSLSGRQGRLLVVCGPEAVQKGANANRIIKELIKIVDGKGGGRADFAMAGIQNADRLEQAFADLEQIIKGIVSN